MGLEVFINRHGCYALDKGVGPLDADLEWETELELCALREGKRRKGERQGAYTISPVCVFGVSVV